MTRPITRRGSRPRAWVLAAAVAVFLVAPALAQEYTLGSRDVVKVTVWGHDDLSRDYAVDVDGTVSFPLVGRVRASGLSPKQLAMRLATMLEKDYLVNPQVSVTIKEYLSQKVHVLGEAEKPGLYYLTGPTTVLELLSRAGGLARTAGRQLVLVRSQTGTTGAAAGSTLLRVNLDRLQAGDAKQNVRLEDGDTVFVPKAQSVFVLGEVKNAGTYPLDRETTVLDAVSLAGGFNDRASPAGVKLIRRVGDGATETVPLDLSGAIPRDRAVTLQDGDTVLVPKGNTFFVFGEVKKPGAYLLDRDTNVLEGITIAGGFTDRAAPGRTRILRSGTRGQEVVTVDVNDILKRGRRDATILLRENDVVVVPESFF